MQLWVGALQTLFICTTVLGSIWFIFSAIRPIFERGDAEAIGAVKGVVEALHLGSVLGYAWGAIATGGYLLEKNRRKSPAKK